MTMTLEQLRTIVENDAAIRRIQKLQPAGGPGDKIFPPTYPGEGNNASARHVFETRRIDRNDVPCVLIDSVQSQANRLEEALLSAVRRDAIKLPLVTVNFAGQKIALQIEGSNKETKVTFGNGTGYDLSDVGEVTSLDAPHRVFDAIIRDSELDGQRFDETDIFASLIKAKPQFASPLFEVNPTALLFGVWHSTGKGGGLGSKFARCIVSEIIGVGASLGEKVSSRIDPLGIRADAKVVGDTGSWTIASGAKGEKSLRPSEINHSNIAPSVVPGGVTIDYGLHTVVITCAGLRRLRFPGTQDEAAARTVLAALALIAIVEQDKAGYALRSRCDLVCDGKSPFKVVHPDGSTDDLEFDLDNAIAIFKEAVAKAKGAGLPWRDEPIKLVPQRRLVELVALSRAKALAGEPEGENA